MLNKKKPRPNRVRFFKLNPRCGRVDLLFAFTSIFDLLSRLRQKKAHLFTDVLFSVIFACGEFYAQVRDIAFGSGMRFAR